MSLISDYAESKPGLMSSTTLSGKKGPKAVTGAVPFQKVCFCI